MAMFRDDSTDDVTCCYLQLEERLRINRGERPSGTRNRGERPSGTNAMTDKDMEDMKQFCNRNRKAYDGGSSSSSSLDTYNDPSIPGPSSGHSLQNKKRQNGDKPVDQFVNPKRTCLDDAFQRDPIRSHCRKMNTNGDIPHSKKVMDFTTNPPQLSTRSLLPGNTYEEHINDFSDFSDFECGPSAADKKTIPPVNKTLPKLSGFFEPPATGSRGVHFVDSTSEDDSRTMQMGSLKGGRQSPDPTSNKMVLRRKIKRVLESDDSDSEEWNVGYRARPLMFSSSDSDDSKPGRRSKEKPSIASKKSANLSFSPRDSQASSQSRGRGRPARSSSTIDPPSTPARSNFHRTRGSNRSMNGAFKSLTEGLAISERQRMPGMPHRRALRSSRDTDAIPAYLPGRSLSDFELSDSIGNVDAPSSSCVPVLDLSLPRNRERNPMITSQPRNSRTSPDTLRSSRRRRPLGRARTLNERPSLAALHPDIFDAEDSSEVEFFTANSYSDNESNTEPLSRRLDCNIFRPASEPEVRTNISINVGSSEDEISVVFSSGPQTRSPRSRTSESRRRPRTLGRRYNRGSRRSSLPQSPGVSLSPDPVEQVRQVEEDERFARVLQAQFDAEADRPHSSPNPCLMNIREATSSDEDTSSVDVEEMLAPALHLNQLLAAPIYFPPERMAEAGPPRSLGMRLNWNPLLSTRAQRRVPDRWPTHAHHPWLQHITLSEDNSYEAFLGLVEMNGDVTRGLQKSQINRLPTRKYATFNSASSSSELPHKRAELNKECQVCLNDYVDGDVLRILPCFHEFHTPCIDPWLKINHTCPVCRVVVDLDE